MAAELWTFKDALDHLLDSYTSDLSERNKRLARRAIFETCREIANFRNWTYYNKRGKLTTVASQTTGTITYVNSTRIVTLVGATFPTDAAYYELLIDDVRYEIESYTDTTHVVLSSTVNPGADISAASEYTLYRDTYPLPDDFMAMGSLVDATSGGRRLTCASVNDVVTANRRIGSTGEPMMFAVTRVAENQGGLGLLFSASPNSARTYDFSYQARPRALGTEAYQIGSVTSSAGLTTLSGTGTAFAAAHAGCVIRLSSSADKLPTPLIGGPQNDLNPFAYQRVIKTVDSTTALTLDSSIATTLTAVKYIISDPIDVEAGAMMTAFLRLLEAQYARLSGRKDAPEKEKQAQASLWAAASADNRTMFSEDYPRGTGSLADISLGVSNAE